MTGLPARRVELVAPRKPDADWTARLALGGAAGFTLLLVAFGFILQKSWPQMSGSDRTMTALTDKTERIANGQEGLSRDIASLRTDLRQDRADRAEGTREVAVLRARVGELAATMTSLREQTDKLESGARPAAAVPAVQPDPAVAELRSRLDALQLKLDQLAAAPAAPSPAPVVPSALADAAVVRPSPAISPASPSPRSPAYPVEEIEREVRDMQSVINQQRARASGVHEAGGPVAVESSSPSSAPAPAAKPRPASGIANPLSPMVSKTPPRIAPTGSGGGGRSMAVPGGGRGEVLTPTVSRVPFEPSAQQTVKPAASAALEARVSRVGVNSAMKSLGPIGLPFDVIGNLFTAIGEGLDTLFTGREYIARPVEDDEPTTARAAR